MSSNRLFAPVAVPAGQALRWPTRARLAVEILVVYVSAVRRLRAGNVREAVDWARSPSFATAPVPDAAVRRLSRAIERTLRPLPTDSRCLVRALVLVRLLACRGRRAEVVLGVRTAGSFGAHAWVEVDGRPVLSTEAEGFERLTAL